MSLQSLPFLKHSSLPALPLHRCPVPPSSHTVFLDIIVILLLHASCVVSCSHSRASPHATRYGAGVSSVPRCSSHVIIQGCNCSACMYWTVPWLASCMYRSHTLLVVICISASLCSMQHIPARGLVSPW